MIRLVFSWLSSHPPLSYPFCLFVFDIFCNLVLNSSLASSSPIEFLYFLLFLEITLYSSLVIFHSPGFLGNSKQWSSKSLNNLIFLKSLLPGHSILDLKNKHLVTYFNSVYLAVLGDAAKKTCSKYTLCVLDTKFLASRTVLAFDCTFLNWSKNK